MVVFIFSVFGRNDEDSAYHDAFKFFPLFAAIPDNVAFNVPNYMNSFF